VDDVLILASGEKVVPAPLEKIIISSPLVGGTLIFGRGRNQVGVLIEPRPGVEVSDISEFRNKIWPVIEEANKTSPAFSRIFKEMILVTNSEKPMLRTPKGTVMKKTTLNIYEKEIDALYDTVEASAKATEDIEPPKSWSSSDLESWLVAHTADIHSGKTVDVEADLFEQGFDSLSATFLRNRIIGALRSSSDANAHEAAAGVTQNIVFSFPTIKQLAAHISVLVLHGGAVDVASAASAKDAINEMIDKYSAGLGDLVPSSGQSAAGAVVLLTGSTGGLGSHLLESLLSNTAVRKVYAYNRSSKASMTMLERQKDAFEDRGLDSALLYSEKLVFVEGDSALPTLGLEPSLFEEIRTSATLIIHNAWRLDFNLSLASFEPNIRSTRNLIDLALASPHASTLRFLFTSSISSAQGWNQSKGPFPEEVQIDAGVAVGGGYGEGKYVAERLLAKSGLQATSFRIGQISGGLPNGAWSTTDWVPSLIKSSLKLGALPDSQGLVSWLPMHAVAKAILDVGFAEEQPTIALNIVHPRPVEWSTVMRDVSDALLAAKVTSEFLPLLPFGEWFEALEGRAKAADLHDLNSIPAIKLLDFFRMLSSADAVVRESGRKDMQVGGLAAFSTDKSQAASPTINDLPLVSADDAQRWVGYWSAKGFFE
jgi:thioester reductase-like protein